MGTVARQPLPQQALLQRYSIDGAYADCYSADIAHGVPFAQYVEAFYTTWLFKAERLILKWAASKPSTDMAARAVAEGRADAFAAWTVEDRATDQLLMRDFTGRTRSWFMTEPLANGGMRLYFGSAVVPVKNPGTGKATLGFVFNALLGFHKLYSRALLRAAVSLLNLK